MVNGHHKLQLRTLHPVKPAVNISFLSNPEAVQADGMEGLILFKKRGK